MPSRLGGPESKLAVRFDATVAILGIASALLIAYRILTPPDLSRDLGAYGTITYDVTVRTPIYLALTAAAGIALGGCWSLWAELGST